VEREENGAKKGREEKEKEVERKRERKREEKGEEKGREEKEKEEGEKEEKKGKGRKKEKEEKRKRGFSFYTRPSLVQAINEHGAVPVWQPQQSPADCCTAERRDSRHSASAAGWRAAIRALIRWTQRKAVVERRFEQNQGACCRSRWAKLSVHRGVRGNF
jgi:hypothetical protein